MHAGSILLGITGGIILHPLTSDGAPSPHIRHLVGPDPPSRSSAYCLTPAPSSSSHHPSTLLSAWYDSHLRIHDLRSPSSSPRVEFWDPYAWADGSAMYSSAFIGEHYIVGGGARHGTVAIFDIRFPKSGWSCFTPGGKGSPVYAMVGEGGRLWGVTEKRGFVLSFDGTGPGQGLVLDEARAKKGKFVHVPKGWRGRGGRWNWTVRYPSAGMPAVGAGAGAGGASSAEGYEHQRGWSGPTPGIHATPGSVNGGMAGGGDEGVDGDRAMGYLHSSRTVTLFESLPAD